MVVPRRPVRSPATPPLRPDLVLIDRVLAPHLRKHPQSSRSGLSFALPRRADGESPISGIRWGGAVNSD